MVLLLQKMAVSNYTKECREKHRQIAHLFLIHYFFLAHFSTYVLYFFLDILFHVTDIVISFIKGFLKLFLCNSIAFL